MKKYLIPAILLFTGVASLFSPLLADGACGTNPTVNLPSKCKAAYEVAANIPSGSCILVNGGACLNTGSCGGFVWSNAIPGQCVSAIITENNIPRCLASYAVTNVTLHDYAMECTYGGYNTCTCVLTPTGNTDPAPVCNCMDMEPLH